MADPIFGANGRIFFRILENAFVQLPEYPSNIVEELSLTRIFFMDARSYLGSKMIVIKPWDVMDGPLRQLPLKGKQKPYPVNYAPIQN